MRINALLIAVLLSTSGAVAQELPTNPPSPPAADPALIPRADNTGPAGQDPVGRIESRLIEIERRLDAQNNVGTQAAPQLAVDPIVDVGNDSRYRYHSGVWWYWLPSNRWVYWSNGAWVDYVPAQTPVIYRSTTPAYSYYSPAYTYGYYPSYGGSYPYYGGYGHGHWGSAIGLGLSIGHGLSHHGHYGGHYGGHGHGGYHGGHGHGGYHGGHGHGGHGHSGHGHGGHH